MAIKIYLSPSNQNANAYATGNTNEMVQCNRIADQAKIALERNGFEVKKATQGQAMATSIAESNKWGAKYHICIHTNAGGGKGTEVFVNSTATANMALAKPIYDELANTTVSKTARYLGKYPYGGTLGEITGTTAITIYCECEFHDNKKYAQFIINNPVAYGEAIAKGACKGCGISYKATTTKPTTPTFKNAVTVTGKTSYLRADGTVSSKVLATVKVGTKLEHILDDVWGWSKVKNASGVTGWIQNTRITGKRGLSTWRLGTFTGTGVLNVCTSMTTANSNNIARKIKPKGTFVIINWETVGGKKWLRTNMTANGKKQDLFIFYDKNYISIGAERQKP